MQIVLVDEWRDCPLGHLEFLQGILRKKLVIFAIDRPQYCLVDAAGEVALSMRLLLLNLSPLLTVVASCLLDLLLEPYRLSAGLKHGLQLSILSVPLALLDLSCRLVVQLVGHIFVDLLLRHDLELGSAGEDRSLQSRAHLRRVLLQTLLRGDAAILVTVLP